jgi:uncharacterized protein YPO0396
MPIGSPTLKRPTAIMRNASSETMQPGFRLARFEVLNWGTFDARVWRIEPDGDNALLTGDIGSGKSTLVDALTTLLVPPRKITYNKAAGAEARERSLYSYVRGEYRSVTNELTGGAQAQALRGETSYSVLLCVFADRVVGRDVTLVQVFWTKEGERNPYRLYVVASGQLAITEDFTGFGADIQNLRKRLRSDRRVALFDTFEEYGSRLRRELGVPHPQALDLFYQTVSMKSVGNLTEFVRRHMLEPDDTEERIQALIANFENLSHAHDAVLRARDQIERLDPLVADGERLEELEAELAELRRAREALSAWFAGHRTVLLERQIEQLEFDKSKWEQQLEGQRAGLEDLSRRRTELQAAIERQGGGRVREIETTIAHEQAERERQRADDADYRRLCTALTVKPGTTLEAFLASVRAAGLRRQEVDADKQRLDRLVIDKAVEFRSNSERDKALSDEIRSLESRASNIPAASIGIREGLAAALGVDPEDLPFAGELMQVHRDAAEWEGAIERLLHGFAMNLLVPESHYAQVNHYVDRTHLHGRLVYLRVRDEAARATGRTVSPQSVVRKLSIKPDSGFYGFLERELAEQFDYSCCDSLEEFRRLPRALTLNGLIKANERRHEKDDRHRIEDRSRYVLGWDNRAKLKALRTEQSELRRRLLAIKAERDDVDRQRQAGEQQLRAADRLLELKEFARIDWRSTVARIQKLEDEKRTLEESDDQLRTLRAQLAQLDQDYAAADMHRQETSRRQGSTLDRLEQASQACQAAREEGAALSEPDRNACVALLEQWRLQVLGDEALELRSLESQQRRMRDALQAKIDAEDKAAGRLRERIVEQMQRYKAAYPAETAEMDASTEALEEYRRRLQALREDDLPRFEARFKELLNKETINSMAAFQAHLQKRRHEIDERIRVINASLASIEYDRSQGTFIELVSMPSPDAEVRDFQTSLRACISGGEEDGELYTEQKFLQVKALVERLNGREGQADVDARWRAKVTDVRNWFEFGAKERWRADGAEREFYRDSSGKSGGQKEKLAYTILAAALAYQFGLGETQARKRHFRFVVIDEAFGRGSDDSTRYGLELFGTLDLQLLIVTPLQKIAVIEDYISAVHFVHNEGGANSIVQNLTIEEYRERKLQFIAAASA